MMETHAYGASESVSANTSANSPATDEIAMPPGAERVVGVWGWTAADAGLSVGLRVDAPTGKTLFPRGPLDFAPPATDEWVRFPADVEVAEDDTFTVNYKNTTASAVDMAALLEVKHL